MKIAVHGCAHGELDLIYSELLEIIENKNLKIDLLICCGDFQAVRDQNDLDSMAVPKKYRKMKDFADYYSGKKKAPVLTLVIGGNHEAASHMWELPYGGWLAEKIFYIGYAGVVNIGGIRIAGLSGIYDLKDYNRGHFEKAPFDESTKRSFYHVRHVDVSRLKMLKDSHIDIMLSHDWPSNIQLHGNIEEIYQQKPYLRDDPIDKYLKGNDPAEELLHMLKPSYWFAAHHHCKFSASVSHETENQTQFLALGKCKPSGKFLHVFEINTDNDGDFTLEYDEQWLSILQNTDHNVKKICTLDDYASFANIDDSKSFYTKKKTVISHDYKKIPMLSSVSQTKEFCKTFALTDPLLCYEDDEDEEEAFDSDSDDSISFGL